VRHVSFTEDLVSEPNEVVDTEVRNDSSDSEEVESQPRRSQRKAKPTTILTYDQNGQQTTVVRDPAIKK